MSSLSQAVARLERDHVGRKRRQKTDFLRHVNVIDFLEALEVANISQATTDEVLCSCPFPGHSHGDEKPSLYMNDGSKDPKLTTVWKCHGCNRSGNAVTFYSEHEHVSRTRAKRLIKEHYAPNYRKPQGGIGTEFEKRRRQHVQERRRTPNEVILLDWKKYDQFRVDWSEYGYNPAYEDAPDVQYMLKRGFTPAELEEWGIGYDWRSDRITIPVCDPDGNLVGIKGRAWRPGVKPKYRILGDKGQRKRYGFKPYEKSLVVFGIDKWGECARYVLCEGEIDVMSFWKMDIPALSTGSASMSDVQARIIRDYADEVVLFFDNDTAGSHGVMGYDKEDGEHKPGIVEILEPFVRVRIVGPHMLDANEYLKRGKADRARQLVENAPLSFVL
jgi:DNA primase